MLTASPSNITTLTPDLNSTEPALNATNITEEQAIAIADPIIWQYAEENNRTITNVTATWGVMADDGSRGGLTLQQALVENLTPSEAHNQFSYYPVWTVTASFRCPDDPNQLFNTYDGVTGYCVTIWADIGQIADSEPQGVM